VLGTNLRGSAYRASADDSVTTTAIVVGSPIDPARQRIVERAREWLRLGDSGDHVRLEVVTGTATVVLDRSVAAATTGTAFVGLGPVDLTSAIGSATSFRLRFRLTSNASTGARGWYLDDLDVVIERR
jgi:hypothetical protein